MTPLAGAAAPAAPPRTLAAPGVAWESDGRRVGVPANRKDMARLSHPLQRDKSAIIELLGPDAVGHGLRDQYLIGRRNLQ